MRGEIRVRKSVPAEYREIEKNYKDMAYKLRTAALKGEVTTKIVFDETIMKLI